jgi:hypothetical protein
MTRMDPSIPPAGGREADAGASGPSSEAGIERPASHGTGRKGRPWGFWATLGWTVLWLVVFTGAGTVVFVAALVALDKAYSVDTLQQAALEEASNGLLIGLMGVVLLPVMVGLTALLAVIRMPLREYLALRWPGYRDTLLSLAGLAALIAGQDVLSRSLERPIVTEFMLTAYRTAGFLPLLVASLVVAAPIMEELFFRGFMYKGLAASKVGVLGAIVVTSLAFAVIHLQYDWYGRATILAVGLFLGVVRWRTKSVALPILLHAVMNAVATVQTAVVAEGWA